MSLKDWQDRVASELDSLAEDVRDGESFEKIEDMDSLMVALRERVLSHMPEDFEDDDEE